MESIPNKKTPILIVDDDVSLLASIRATLLSAGMPEPAVLSDGRRVFDLLRTHQFQVILLDLILPSISGMDILKKIKKEFPSIECVIITAVGEVSSAVEAMRCGAYDYLVKPIESEKLTIVVNRAFERFNLHHTLSLFTRHQSFSDLKKPQAFQDMIAEDESMARIFHQVEAVSPTDYSILITGESGTGKEMLARIIHALSFRSRGPFVAVNMGSLSIPLFEADFFGHSKGAFTGAQTERKGFLETAQGGSVFLDEITELDPDLQGKLLRVIEEKELYRLGSSDIRRVDVRFIASTNRDVHELIKNGRFRNDLFYRLDTFHIHLPPLRERKKDILPLANYFLRLYVKQNQKEIDSVASDLAERLLTYSFPGNIRELKNIIASGVLLEKTNSLTLASSQNSGLFLASKPTGGEGLLSLAEVEKRHLLCMLDAVGGNRTKAAKILGIGLKTLRRKLKESQK
jgi:DNA-binding NtrC family response regulator